MKKDILMAFGIACTVACVGLVAHVNDTELSYDYGHQYNHEKAEFETIPHHDGENFPNYNDWLGSQLEKEDQAKTLIDKGIAIINQWTDPFSAGVDASTYIVPSNISQEDHDRPSAEHESESNYR
jgi:hypothetical protein